MSLRLCVQPNFILQHLGIKESARLNIYKPYSKQLMAKSDFPNIYIFFIFVVFTYLGISNN